MQNFGGFNPQYLNQNLTIVISALECYKTCKNRLLKLAVILINCWKIKTEFPRDDLFRMASKNFWQNETTDKKSKVDKNLNFTQEVQKDEYLSPEMREHIGS